MGAAQRGRFETTPTPGSSEDRQARAAQRGYKACVGSASGVRQAAHARVRTIGTHVLRDAQRLTLEPQGLRIAGVDDHVPELEPSKTQRRGLSMHIVCRDMAPLALCARADPVPPAAGSLVSGVGRTCGLTAPREGEFGSQEMGFTSENVGDAHLSTKRSPETPTASRM